MMCDTSDTHIIRPDMESRKMTKETRTERLPARNLHTSRGSRVMCVTSASDHSIPVHKSHSEVKNSKTGSYHINFHTKSYIISYSKPYHIISYHIISYHIISSRTNNMTQQDKNKAMTKKSQPKSETCFKKSSHTRRVSFALDHDEEQPNASPHAESAPLPVPLPVTLTEEDCEALWYQPEEVAAFKADIRYLIMYYAESRSSCTSHDEDDDMRGLERYNLERSTYKKSAIYYVLMAQKKSKGNPKVIRMVSKRCTGWAQELALHQGFEDFCAVYDPLETLLGRDEDDQHKNYNDSLFNKKEESCCLKRKVVEEPDLIPSCGVDDRRVRQRITMTHAPTTTSSILT
jgi:hypothetical protein